MTSAKQGPGQGLDEVTVSHEDLKLVLEDDWSRVDVDEETKKQGQGLTSLSYVSHTFKTSNMHNFRDRFQLECLGTAFPKLF